MSAEPQWLVWSNEHSAWWAQNGNGYTFDRASAGRFTLARAVDILKDANLVRPTGQIAPQESIVREDCFGEDDPIPPFRTLESDLGDHATPCPECGATGQHYTICSKSGVWPE